MIDRFFVFASKNVFKTCFRYTEGYAFLIPQKNASMVEGLRSLLPMLFLKKQKFIITRVFPTKDRFCVFASKNVFKTYFNYTKGYAFLMPQKNARMVMGLRS